MPLFDYTGSGELSSRAPNTEHLLFLLQPFASICLFCLISFVFQKIGQAAFSSFLEAYKEFEFGKRDFFKGAEISQKVKHLAAGL